MTSLEFQTATDFQRVRLILAELNALEASENVGAADSGRWIIDVDLIKMRRDVRAWEKALMDSLTIKAQRADTGKSRKSSDGTATG